MAFDVHIDRERKSGFNYYVTASGSPVYNISMIVIFGFRVIVSITGFFFFNFGYLTSHQ